LVHYFAKLSSQLSTTSRIHKSQYLHVRHRLGSVAKQLCSKPMTTHMQSVQLV